MLSAHLLVVATVVVVLLIVTPSPSWALTVNTLRLQLFNDSSCTTGLPIADISQPVPANGLGQCAAAPSSLSQLPELGYSSYQASCGISVNNQSFAFVHLWANSSVNASSCPTTASLVTFLTVGDSSVTHNSQSCVGPVTVSTLVNQSTILSSRSEERRGLEVWNAMRAVCDSLYM